jgi:hypothetical protein
VAEPPRGGLLLVLALAASALVFFTSDWAALLGHPDAWTDTDYQLHWAAGRALAAGQDPYDAATVERIGSATGRPFTPFCAAAPLWVAGFARLGELSFEQGYRALLDLNVVLLLLGIAALAAALRSVGVPGAAAAGAALALVTCNDGTWMALWCNQLNFITLAALTGALWAGVSGRPRTEGALLAVATWAKLSPGLILVFAALTGRWRTVRAAAVTGLVLLALSIALAGWPAHTSWLAMTQRELGFAAQRPAGLFNNSLHAWNLSPNGVLSRAGAAAGWSRGAVLAGGWAAALAAAGAAVWVLRRARDAASPGAPRDVFALHAAGLAAGFLASPTTWVTHLSLAAVPLAFVLWRAWERRAGCASVLCASAAAVLLFLPLGTLGSAEDQRLDILAKLDGCVLLLAAVLMATREPAGAAPSAERPPISCPR